MAHTKSGIVVVTAVVVVVVAVGILLVAGGNRRGTPDVVRHHDGHAPPLPAQGLFVVNTAQARLVHTVALPTGLGGGDVGGGFGWLADDDGVLQLNPRTGSPVKTLRIAGGAAAVVYVGGKLWVATPGGSTPPSATTNVLEVDPQVGAIHPIFVPDSSDSIYRGGGYVWVPGRTHIARIDPATRQIRRLPIRLAQPNMGCAATYADSVLWIADARLHDQLLEIDPRSLTVEHHTAIPDPGEPEYCVTAGAGRVWVGSTRGSDIYAIDPRTARPTGVALHVGRMHWMTGTRDALWFSTAEAPATLRAVAGDGTPAATVALPARPAGFEAFGTLLYAGFARPT